MSDRKLRSSCSTSLWLSVTLPMVISTLSLLTAALVTSLHSSVAQEENAPTSSIINLSGTTLEDGTRILTENVSTDFVQAVSGCPATTSFFTVEAAIFPAGHQEEGSTKSLGPVLQSCLSLGRRNPAKAFKLCAQLAAVSYMLLSGADRTTVTREMPAKLSQTSRKSSTDAHNEGTDPHGSTAQDEKATVQKVLQRIRNGFTQILPFWAFASSFTNRGQASFPSQSLTLPTEAGLVASIWNTWKFGPTSETDPRTPTEEGNSLVPGPTANLGTLFCRNLAEFHAENSACGVAKFAKTSFAAAYASRACSLTQESAESSLAFAHPSVNPVPTEKLCRGEAEHAVDLPLVPLQEYRKIISSPGESSAQIPSQVLQREGVTYSRLWEALDRLYQFHEQMRCSSAGCQLPCLLPGWTPELLVDVTEPHHTQQNPLCVFARRDESLLIVIRGALTPAEWALTTEYELADFSPGYGESVGKVSIGILKVFAAIWPALQTFLAISRVQQGLQRIIVTGHSMGAAAGALISAALAASSVFDKEIDAVLFASPRPGDTLFMNFWKQQVNGRAVQFSLDVIAELPCLLMPVCEERETTYLDITTLMAGLSQVHRSAQAGAQTKNLSIVYEYGDYPNAVVFQPSELPNASDQQSAHIRYNHFCAYACWLGTRFDSNRRKTMCNKRTGVHSSTQDPSVCSNQ